VHAPDGTVAAASTLRAPALRCAQAVLGLPEVRWCLGGRGARCPVVCPELYDGRHQGREDSGTRVREDSGTSRRGRMIDEVRRQREEVRY